MGVVIGKEMWWWGEADVSNGGGVRLMVVMVVG